MFQKTNLQSIVVALVAIFLFSCAPSDKVVTNGIIQKRKYNKGYHVALAKKTNKDSKVKSTPQVDKVELDKYEKQVSAAEETSEEKVVSASNQEDISSLIISDDNITATNTAEIAQSTAVTVINTSKKVQRVINKVEKKIAKEQNKSKTTKSKSSKKSSGKSQLIALLLCFFVGGIGVHRFYLGYTWQGVVQFLTLGACGIWSLIDFIRIITGDLGPKDGDYSKKL